MEVQFEPALQARLDQIAHESGCAAADLVQDAVASYMEGIAELRTTLDRRYEEIRSGKVKPVPGDEIEAHFSRKFEAARRSQRGR
jgi:predicted transcriptional regulator